MCTTAREGIVQSLSPKEILIQFLDGVTFGDDDPNVMFNHQLSQSLAANDEGLKVGKPASNSSERCLFQVACIVPRSDPLDASGFPGINPARFPRGRLPGQIDVHEQWTMVAIARPFPIAADFNCATLEIQDLGRKQ